VQEGAEQDLRHFLESVVLQVNSDLGLLGVDDAALDLAPGTDGEDGGSDHVSRKARDRHMAAAFRGFAASDS
jgi:hypothetical protein